MWLARIARPDAIYDASAAARNFANFKPVNRDEIFSGGNEKGMLILIILNRAISNIPHGLKFYGGESGDANKVNSPKQSKKFYKAKTHFKVSNLIS